jgi:bifunctional non-homologous end joining protein LigD
MLATLTAKRFFSKEWIFERKLDGERCLAFRRGEELRLLSRNRKRLNETYPEIVDALLEQKADEFVADGEIVAFEGRMTSFAKLQQRMQLRSAEEARARGVPAFFYLFDLVHLDGFDTAALGLRHRKALLRRALAFADPLRFMTHRNAEGEAFYREACKKGWEGLMAKRADVPYRHARSHDWLKFKCVNEQEFVIGGYTDPQGRRTGFGALLVGYYEGGRLVYAGKVGTGYTQETLERLGRRLGALERRESPFAGNDLPRQNVHWVRPDLVAQIGFTEVTGDGKLRHPRFQGLRRDKPPHEVVLERGSR